METIAQVAATLQVVLGEAAVTAAHVTGCVRRRRAFDGPRLVQTLVLGWLAEPAATLAQLCQVAAARGVTISRQGLAQRFTPTLVTCLEQVLGVALRQVVTTDPAALPLLDRFAVVLVHDSTVIRLPDTWAERWPGCGGRRTAEPTTPTPTAPARGDATEPARTLSWRAARRLPDGAARTMTGVAALKVQVGLDLRSGQFCTLSLHPGRAHDGVAAPDPATLPATALSLTDLGYFDLDRLRAHQRAGQHWVVTPKAHTIVWRDGVRQTVTARLRQAERAAVGSAPLGIDEPVALGAHHRLPCRLVAVPLPPATVNARLRKLRDAARKQGLPISDAQRRLAQWSVYVTTLPADQLSAAEVRCLGRVRWQIELVFKRWKSLGQVDAWRSAQPDRILAEVYAKLLGQLLAHWLTLTGAWSQPDRSLWQAYHVIRGHARDLARCFDRPDDLQHLLTTLARILRSTCRVGARAARPAFFQLCASTAPP